MKLLATLSLIVLALFACQKSKWSRNLAVRSGKWKLIRYEIDGADSSHLIQAFVLDFKDKDPGKGVITELVTTKNYSKGYNTMFNINGAVNIPNIKAPNGLEIFLSFSNARKLEDCVGFWEVNDFNYGSTRTFRPSELSRTKFTFEFPYNLLSNAADTNKIVQERFVFEKLP